MVNDEFISTWVERLRTEIPGAAAILLKGSYARREPGPFSDIDFDVLVHGESHENYLAWFVEHNSRLVHISVAVNNLASWSCAAGDSEPWAFGLPVHETTRLLWAADQALREKLDRSARVHPPGDPELEDFIEAFGKIRNAMDRNDDLALRLAAQTLGGLCPSLLRPINPAVHPSHHHDALLAALEFPIAPDGYCDDLLLCLGLSGTTTTMRDIHDAARRLTHRTVSLVRQHADDLKGTIPPDLQTYLLDGTLERYVTQRATDSSREDH